MRLMQCAPARWLYRDPAVYIPGMRDYLIPPSSFLSLSLSLSTPMLSRASSVRFSYDEYVYLNSRRLIE